MKIIKRFVKLFFNSLGFDLRRLHPEIKNLSFDEILKKNLSQDPLILDVGANKGQTIRRFLNLFDNPTIHAFEPVEEAIQEIRDNYSKHSRTIRRDYASSAIFLSILLKKNNNLGPIVDIFINSHPCEPKRSKFFWS